jgi:putative membrane protein
MFCGFGGYGPGIYGAGAYNSGWLFFFMAFRILIFAAVIILAYKLIKHYGNKSRDVIKMLDMAYAKGEINEEEYIKRKNVLTRKS